MSERTVVVLVCDLCGKEGDLVQTHLVAIDGTAVEAEACDKCWGKAVKALVPLSKAGRVPALVKVSKRAELVPFPGTAWRFTNHALVRMGERKVAPLEVAEAADNPTVTHPGRVQGQQVHIRGSVKVVLDPKREVILTVSRRDEEVESVA